MSVGYQTFAADGVVGTSGEPTIVYGINIVSNGGAVGRVILRNGAVVGATAVVTVDGTTGIGIIRDFGGNGILFPSGCYLDLDSNTAQATVFFERL